MRKKVNISEVAKMYEAGETLKDTAKSFGIAEETCRRHLKTHGVKIRIGGHKPVKRTKNGKVCATCRKLRPWEEFWKTSAKKDGHVSSCIYCKSKRRARPKKTQTFKPWPDKFSCCHYTENLIFGDWGLSGKDARFCPLG